MIVCGEYKIAQYGQWDGYPSGQGRTALEFCRTNMTTIEGRETFKSKLKRVRFVADNEMDDLYVSVGVSKTAEYLLEEQSKAFNEKYPYFSRNNGARILEMVWNSSDTVLLRNELEFAADSLFCEWAYVIDLDANTFEIYKGFQREPLPSTERFAALMHNQYHRGNNYYPVRCIRKYSLDDLPSEEAFLNELAPKDEE